MSEKLAELEEEINGNGKTIIVEDTFSDTHKQFVAVTREIKSGEKFIVRTNSTDVEGASYNIFANASWSSSEKVTIDNDHIIGTEIEYIAPVDLHDIRLFAKAGGYGTVEVTLIFGEEDSGIIYELNTLKNQSKRIDEGLSEVKDEIKYINDTIEGNKEDVEETDINDISWIYGRYTVGSQKSSYGSGTTNKSETEPLMRCTVKIDRSLGDRIRYSKITTETENVAAVAFYSAAPYDTNTVLQGHGEDALVGSASFEDSIVEIPENAYGMSFTFFKGQEKSFVCKQQKITKIPDGIKADIEKLQEDTNLIDGRLLSAESDIEKLKEGGTSDVTEIFEHYPKNLINYDDEDYKEGYSLKANVLEESSTLNTTGFIPVKEGEIYRFVILSGALSQKSMRFLNYYDKNKNYLGYKSSSTDEYIAESGVAFIRASITNSYMYKGRGVLFSGETPDIYTDYFEPYTTERFKTKFIPTFGGMRVKGILATNEEMETGKVNVAKNTSIIAIIDSSFNNVRIGIKGDTTADGNYARYLELTPTTYSVYSAKGIESGFPKNHGLTLGNHTSVVLEKTISDCKLTITNEYGDAFIDEDIPWTSTYGRAYVTNMGGTDIDVSLAFMLRDINKDVWLFGSSYLGMTNPARWPYYLVQEGHTNWLMNAKPGEIIIEEVDDFKTLLSLGCKPKYVFLHCSSNGALNDTEEGINKTWKYYFDVFNAICKESGITPVYYLPHNSGTRFNDYKKQYVIGTGERYIDSDKPVQNGVDYLWKGWGTEDALLSNDQVHPTIKGAKVLYSQVIADFPEILVDGK